MAPSRNSPPYRLSLRLYVVFSLLMAVSAALSGLFLLYGPFNYGGAYTSESNARFDQWLKERDPQSAIRDFEAVDGLGRAAGMNLVEDNAMPANNRLLVWRRSASK